MPEKMISLLLVDDHAVVRNGIRLMLSNEHGIEVTGEASTAQEALVLMRDQDFDVVLLDLGLPDKPGLDLLQRIHREKPQTAILIFSMFEEEIYGIRAFKLGASGFLPKNSEIATIVSAVTRVAAGGKYISQILSDKLVNVVRGEHTAQFDTLTNREVDVLRLLATGKALTAIAEALNLSPSTITSYRSRILEKTGLKNNVQLARYVQENNLR